MHGGTCSLPGLDFSVAKMMMASKLYLVGKTTFFFLLPNFGITKFRGRF